MIALLVGGALIAAVAGVAIGSREILRRVAATQLATWARSHDVAVEGTRARITLDGIAVTVDVDVRTTASARYVLGDGPRFALAAPRIREKRRALDADALVQAVHARYRRRGLASAAVPRVVAAIAKCVRAPVTPPDLAAGDDGLVHVVGDVGDIDTLVALAASIASFDLRALSPFAKALGSDIEIGQDGLAFFDVARRQPIRITLRADPSGKLGLVASGTIEPGAPDLVHAPFEAFGRTRGKLAAPRPDAAEALDWLVDHGAHVSVRPREVTVRYAEPPEIEALVRVTTSLEVLLAHGGDGAYR